MGGGEIWKNIVKWRDQFVINLTMVWFTTTRGRSQEKLIYPYIFYTLNSYNFYFVPVAEEARELKM